MRSFTRTLQTDFLFVYIELRSATRFLHISSAVGLFALFLSAGASTKKPEVTHAPLPQAVLAAKTVFIENDTARAELADQTYSLLLSWGRFRVASSRDGADLILNVSVQTHAESGTQATFQSNYNYQTGAWVNGTATAPSVDTYHFVVMKLIDQTGQPLWVDSKIQWRKHKPLTELIDSLRERISEQEH